MGRDEELKSFIFIFCQDSRSMPKWLCNCSSFCSTQHRRQQQEAFKLYSIKQHLDWIHSHSSSSQLLGASWAVFVFTQKLLLLKKDSANLVASSSYSCGGCSLLWGECSLLWLCLSQVWAFLVFSTIGNGSKSRSELDSTFQSGQDLKLAPMTKLLFLAWMKQSTGQNLTDGTILGRTLRLPHTQSTLF